ncbi:MAG: FtsW/RodA/SpoVE family cell cycle protein, partial [Bacilli bacterium]
LGIIPVTGITLPFFSYGGSSLLVSLASIGIILNISKNK